jgi:tetratricopeptide (TPR) repeat protein
MSLADTDQDPLHRAAALQNSGQLAEAVAIYREHAKTHLTVTLARNLGLALSDLGQFEEAEQWTSLAARNRAGDANLRLQLGTIYAALNRTELAELEFRTALALKPDFGMANLALASLYLSVGRYAEGWPLLQARVALHPGLIPAGPTSYPEWRGEPLAGKTILIQNEQGFGDQIQMSRFVTYLKRQGASRVTLCCRPPLASLFAELEGVDVVKPIDVGARVRDDRHDYWSRYFSLPQHLGVTLQNLPNAPYLTAPADRRLRWGGYSGVGLCWRASPSGFNASNKNLPPADAQRLLDLGAISLHPEDTGANDFADTAAIIEQLDLVISIDTAVAHLAGAMGKPCWTLLPLVKLDWRWLRGRADSPWHPSMRLYRKSSPDNWASVMDAVCADLAAFRIER